MFFCWIGYGLFHSSSSFRVDAIYNSRISVFFFFSFCSFNISLFSSNHLHWPHLFVQCKLNLEIVHIALSLSLSFSLFCVLSVNIMKRMCFVLCSVYRCSRTRYAYKQIHNALQNVLHSPTLILSHTNTDTHMLGD